MNRFWTTTLKLIGLFAMLGLTTCTANPTPQNTAVINLKPMVRGCAETDKGMAARAEGKEVEPSIEVVGNSILYSRSIQHQCCRKVEFEYTIKDQDIMLYEIWSGEGCRCMCFSEIGAELENIPAGSYTMRVIMKDGLPGIPSEDPLIIEKEIKIP
jgi:hypothetical protein